MTSSSERVSSTWSRDDITSCECKEKPYRHVHCPCFGCQGRATDRKTELRHWKETHEFAVENSSYQSDVNSDVFTIFCSNKIHMISCVGKRTEL